MKKTMLALASVTMLVLALGVITQAQAPAKVAGTWIMTNMGRNGVMMTTLTLTQDGATFKGTMKPETGDAITIDAGTISGNDISWSVMRAGRNGTMKVDYKGTVNGDMIKGTFMMGQNSVDWTAKRS